MYTEQKDCRVCGGELQEVLSLGNIYPSTFTETSTDLKRAPLTLAVCQECELVQLKHTVDLDQMYKYQYWYKSALNKSMIAALKDVVDKALKHVNLESGDKVLDIGANDGTLLSFYPQGIIKYGVDPAQNLAAEAEKNCDVFINDYFSGFAEEQFKIITSIAMFYDLPDPRQFVEHVKDCLAPDGIWIVQFTDLYSMLKVNAIDNLCHEHLEYYDLTWMDNFFKSLGLRIFEVEFNAVNGSSIRAYIDHGVREVKQSVIDALKDEASFGDKLYNLELFSQRVNRVRKDLLDLLIHLNLRGEQISLLGASTKGNTLLQYYGIDSEVIPLAGEVNEDKFGLRTVGTNILIVPEEEVLSSSYLLVLPWHFKEMLIKKLGKYLSSGGHMIFPLPEVTIEDEKAGIRRSIKWSPCE